MTTLIPKHERDALAARIMAEIDSWCEYTYDDGHRNHLGASMIGNECLRYLVYSFRWVKHVKQGGRKQRLFNRGHLEELRWCEWLRGIGFKVWDVDTNNKQFRIKGVSGHFGGSLDGIAEFPSRYSITDPMLSEFKTHNEKSFTKLAGKLLSKWPVYERDRKTAEGVQKSKPVHFAQMCTYGYKYGFKYALYCAINKDSDEIYVEIVELDWNLGATLEEKSNTVIGASALPPRINENASFMTCKFCDYSGICHRGEPYEKNCRSCKFATPVKDGEWWCGQVGAVIPNDTIPVGCPSWSPFGRN